MRSFSALLVTIGFVTGQTATAQIEMSNSPIPIQNTDQTLVDKGRALFESFGCGACHRRAGVAGARGDIGPALDRFGTRAYIAGVLPNRPDNLLRWLMDPPAVATKTAMPDMGLSQEQARAIAAWLYENP